MASVMTRERATLSTYQLAICTGRGRPSICCGTAFCIRTPGDNLKPPDHRYGVVSLGMILFDFNFDFVSIVIGIDHVRLESRKLTSNIECFTFVFIVKGLFVSFVHCFIIITILGKVCVLETHPHDVASCHAPIIKFLIMLQSMYLHFIYIITVVLGFELNIPA